MSASFTKYDNDLHELREALRADAAGVAEALLGPPNRAHSTANEWRWGSKGSLAVVVRGPKRGLWNSHEGGTGSNLLGLIRHHLGCNFHDAVAWARGHTGLAEAPTDDIARDARRARQEAEREARQARQAQEGAEAAEARRQQVDTAQRIARAVQPIADTLGAYYFKQHRGIAPRADGWPAAIGWHPGHRAVLAIATAADGSVQAVQRIHLAEDGGKVGPEEIERRRLRAVKVTNGVLDGAAVRLPGDPAGPLVLAEGPETGMAVHSATGHETWVALGGIGHLAPSPGRQVLVIADDDPKPSDPRHGAAAKALNKALAKWRQAGVDLRVVRPWPRRRYDHSDLADVILHHGPASVAARINAALSPGTAPSRRVSVDEARRQVAAAVGGFFDKVNKLSIAMADPTWNEMPDASHFTHAVRVDVGVGKSHEARGKAAATLAAMRARGDMRTLVLAIPTHALAEEQATAFMALPAAQEAGLRAAIWRGRAAADPAKLIVDQVGKSRAIQPTMCGDLERVKDAQSVGLAVQAAVCKGRTEQPDGKKATAMCPLYQACSYQAQMRRKADLWIVAHDLLFHEKPKTMGEVAAVIVDEAAWRKGLIGAEGRHLSLSLDTLEQACTVRYPSGSTDRDGTARLANLRSQLLELLRELPDGPLRRGDIQRRSSLSAGSFVEATLLEWGRKVEALHPGQSKQERKDAMVAAEGNRTIVRMAMAWHALLMLLSASGPEASGHIALATEQGKDGPVRVLRLKGRAEVKEGWKAPTLLLDALLPMDLVRPFWPDVQLVADVKAEMPHQRVRQVIDRAFAKSMLEQLVDEDGNAVDSAEARRRQNRLQDLRTILIREARRHYPGRVLVVVQQAVEAALRVMPRLPPNIDMAHHNSVAGRDHWRDVAALIVVGRTQPSPSGVERITEALTGRAMPAPVDWYERGDAVREMADGTTLPAEADRHPDPMAEAIRWQIAEGELVQIIGRGRGVNRTAANPLEVLVLTDLALPVPLNGTLEAAELEPSVADRMLAAGGVVFANARHVATAYPHLWPSHDAAAKALERARSPTFPYRSIYIGECRTPPPIEGRLAGLRYQVVGAGQKPAVAEYDPVLCPDPATFLTERLGTLAWSKVEGDLVPPDPPPRARRTSKPAPAEGSAAVPAVDSGDGHDPPPVNSGTASTGTVPAEPLPMPQPAEEPMPIDDGGLPPGDLYPAGFAPHPHPAHQIFDALPVTGLWSIKRPALPGLVVMEVTSAFRVISSRPDVEAPEPRPWVRVQGPDGMTEPILTRVPKSFPRASGHVIDLATASSKGEQHGSPA